MLNIQMSYIQFAFHKFYAPKSNRIKPSNWSETVKKKVLLDYHDIMKSTSNLVSHLSTNQNHRNLAFTYQTQMSVVRRPHIPGCETVEAA